MTGPTVTQLHNLADRAERHGGLTPAEAARLREGINSGSGWAAKVAALRLRLHTLHAPIMRGGRQICAHCSSWDGMRCLGQVAEWPCATLTALDQSFPVQETAA